IAALLKQRCRQQQVYDHPGRQLAQPALAGAAIGEDRINHLERHYLGQLTQMTRAVQPLGYRDLAGDDTVFRQRSSLRRAILAESPSTGAPLLLSGDLYDHARLLPPKATH